MKKASFPLPLELKHYKQVLVFVPHPDDEAIGCGGLLAKLAKQGASVKTILVSDGSGDGALPLGTNEIREKEFITSLGILGIQEYECWRFPDGHLATTDLLEHSIKSAITTYQPDLILAPWYFDMHLDHSTIGYFIKNYAESTSANILFYEVWTPLTCTHILDISDVITVKQAAILSHKTALKYGHYVEGSFGLASYRALYLPFEKTLKYAEAYHLYQKTKKGWLHHLWKKY